MKTIFLILGVLISTSSLGQTTTCEHSKLIDSLTKKTVYQIVEFMPEPEGGMQVFYQRLLRNIKFKKPCQPIEFAFIVDEVSKIDGLRVLTKKYNNLENEILEIVQNTKWKAGTCGGRKLPVILTISIKIKCG